MVLHQVCAAALVLAVLPAFSTELPTTVLDVRVTDPISDRPIHDLDPGDFEVRENGVRQTITLFAPEDVPLDLVLLLQAGVEVGDAVDDFLDALGPEDRVAVMRFRGKSRLLLPFSNDLTAIGDAVEQARTWGVTGVRYLWRGREPNELRICDAAWEASELFDTPPACRRRRAILILTDDRDSPSTLVERDVAVKLEAAGASLTGAILRTYQTRQWPSWPLITIPAKADIEETRCQAVPLIEATGGELLRKRAPGRALGGLVNRLRSRYLLGYVRTPAPVEEVSLDIRLPDTDANLSFRLGHCESPSN